MESIKVCDKVVARSELIKEEIKESDKKLATKNSVQVNIVPINSVVRQKYRGTCTDCPHPERKHYAKGMCNYCYHTYGRTKLATACKHFDRKSYAKSMCHSCYQTYKWQQERAK